MKLALFYFAAFLVAGVTPGQVEENKEKNLQSLLQWYRNDIDELRYRFDELMLSWINPETLANIGDECAVGAVALIPDPFHWLPTYYGEVRTLAGCYDGLPAYGSTFDNDWKIRGNNPDKDAHLCCLPIQCGPDLTGYCAEKTAGCKDIGVVPLRTSNCPGSNAMCCPTTAQRSDATIGENPELTALGDPANTDLFTGGDISLLGTLPPGQDVALGTDPLSSGTASLNLDDWTVSPPTSENLFLANDDSNDYGTFASIGGGSLGDFESTA